VKKVFLILICFLLIPFAFNASALSKICNNYHIRNWDNSSGLDQNTITALLQDETGYIWIATPSGLIRFDGIRFHKYDKSNTPAIKSNHISTLYQDSNGVLWIGTEGGGVISFKDDKFKSYTTDNGLSDNHIHAITSDWQGRIWVGTDYGLNTISGDKIKVYTKEDGLLDNIITALSMDIQGDLLIGTFRAGILRFNETIIENTGYKEGLKNLSVSRLFTDSNGRFWIGTLDGLYFQNIEDGEIIPLPGTEGIPITDIIQDSEENIWFSTMVSGIACLQKAPVNNIILPDNFIHCLLQDANGNIWAGTDAAGLIQLRESVITNISKENGLPENVVTTIVQDKSGNIWAGTRDHGVSQIINNQAVHKIDSRSGISSNRISALFVDNNSRLWIGTENAGITQIGRDKIFLPELASSHIKCFLQGYDDSTWIGTSKGLYLYRDRRIELILENKTINTLYRGNADQLFVATSEGLYQSTSEGFSLYEYKISERYPDILSISQDSTGALWLGTNGSGLIGISDDNFKTLSMNEGLPDNHIFNLVKDSEGNLWSGSYNGVFMLSKNDLKNVLLDSVKYVVPIWHDESDGMLSSQCQPSAGFISENKLYMPTSMGISVFNLQKERAELKSIPVTIENISTELGSITVENGIGILPTGSELVDFQVTAFEFSSPGKLHFRYKLEGFDSDFIYLNSGKERNIIYKNLPAGTYDLYLQAASYNSVWEGDPARINLILPVPFYYQRYFLISLTSILILSAIIILNLLRYNKQKKIRGKYKTISLNAEKADQTLRKLNQIIDENKFYLNPDITLKDLAKDLHIHPNHLSRLINENFKLSFNDFVNKYRIAEAKNLLTDPENKNRTILELMYTCGFYSKSTFNTAFKKFTGQTPSEYRKIRQ